MMSSISTSLPRVMQVILYESGRFIAAIFLGIGKLKVLLLIVIELNSTRFSYKILLQEYEQ